ncbi:MAG: hypothetical protein C0614_12850 [Desulfuromonas sp.]|nr:MAG: hypothetical protein C0614_12850 [Desulfuromonas sp.]
MKISVGEENGVVIVSATGRMVCSTEVPLRCAINEVLEESRLPMLFDLSGVEFMDSSGLSLCIETHRLKSSRGEAFVCVGLNNSLLRLFQVSQANMRIPICENLQDGLALIANASTSNI